jgi:3-oxoacyl-[acyl-carrier protein] reductase
MREAARRLRSGGPIVNFTSVVGTKFELAASAPDKIGVETLTAILSKELRGRPIR